MNIIILIIGMLITFIGIILTIVRHTNSKYAKTDCRKYIALICLGVFIGVASGTFIIIPTGYTGVKSTFGQIDNTPLQAGFYTKVPFAQTIATVNNKQQDINFESDSIWGETSARTAIEYKNVIVTYQINPEKSAWIYANIADYQNNLISKPIVASGIKSASKTLDDTTATNRAEIEPLAMDYIQKSLDGKYGKDTVRVNKVIINDADFEKSYNEAIASKQKAQLAAETQEIINEQNIAKAEAEAKTKAIQAEANAKAVKIKAEGDASANKLINDSLTDKVLKQRYLEKWDGKLPQVTSDDNSIMVDLKDK